MAIKDKTGNRTTFNDGTRHYTWIDEDGTVRKYPSVTTILSGGIPKPALINWAKKVTAEYAVANYGELGSLIKVDKQGAIDWLKGAAYRERDVAALRGTDVHKFAEAWQLGEEPELPEGAAGETARRFLEFCEAKQPKFAVSEVQVFNKTHMYAGTLDFIAEIDGVPLLVDIKTGKDDRVYPEYALQLTAYRHGEWMGLPDGSSLPMPEVRGSAVLKLWPKGWRLASVDSGEDVFRSFLYVQQVWRWGDALSQLVIGEDL